MEKENSKQAENEGVKSRYSEAIINAIGEGLRSAIPAPEEASLESSRDAKSDE